MTEGTENKRCGRRHIEQPETGEQNGYSWHCLRDSGHDGPCRPYPDSKEARRTDPLCNLLMPHDTGLTSAGVVGAYGCTCGCPPRCPRREWAEATFGSCALALHRAVLSGKAEA